MFSVSFITRGKLYILIRLSGHNAYGPDHSPFSKSVYFSLLESLHNKGNQSDWQNDAYVEFLNRTLYCGLLPLASQVLACVHTRFFSILHRMWDLASMLGLSHTWVHFSICSYCWGSFNAWGECCVFLSCLLESQAVSITLEFSVSIAWCDSYV